MVNLGTSRPEDSDSLRSELDEFYSYVEIAQVLFARDHALERLASWRESTRTSTTRDAGRGTSTRLDGDEQPAATSGSSTQSGEGERSPASDADDGEDDDTRFSTAQSSALTTSAAHGTSKSGSSARAGKQQQQQQQEGQDNLDDDEAPDFTALSKNDQREFVRHLLDGIRSPLSLDLAAVAAAQTEGTTTTTKTRGRRHHRPSGSSSGSHKSLADDDDDDEEEGEEPDSRYTSLSTLLYLAHGSFARSCPDVDAHLHRLLLNAQLLREQGAIQVLWDAFKDAGARWEHLSVLPETTSAGSAQSSMGPSHHGGGGGRAGVQESDWQQADALEAVNAELQTLLAVMYFVVEPLRADETLGDELMQLDPPMPFHLFSIVASLRDRNAKGYPVKKLLLLLWKSILACIGGMKDIERAKAFVRQVEGLPADLKPRHPSHQSAGAPNVKPITKVAPMDYQVFRNEITSKYPTYLPPPAPLPVPGIDIDRISAAAAPAPVKPAFSYHADDGSALAGGGMDSEQEANGMYSWGGPNGQQQQQQMQPGTPAPSPPQAPAPKPKKQQYQTDQSRPFVLPFSRANAALAADVSGTVHDYDPAGDPAAPAQASPLLYSSDVWTSLRTGDATASSDNEQQPLTSAALAQASRAARIVPRSIDEAGALYVRHMRVSTELWQTWKLREEYIADETGILRAAEEEQAAQEAAAANAANTSRSSGVATQQRSPATATATSNGNGSKNLQGPLRASHVANAYARRLGDADVVMGAAAGVPSHAASANADGVHKLSQRLSALAMESSSAEANETIERDDDGEGQRGQEQRGKSERAKPQTERRSAVEEETEDDEKQPVDPLGMLRKLIKQMQKDERAEPDDKKRRALAARTRDVIRLERVELFYRHTLSNLQSAVIVLLKLVLATVTANNTSQQGGGAGGPNGQLDGAPDPQGVGFEDVDIMRHREITSKAVSAILLLTLRWFKTSHIMKFQYLAQLLVDSNCLLLILKMFGLQEVAQLVKAKNEVDDFNFFQYCHLYGSKRGTGPRPDDAVFEARSASRNMPPERPISSINAPVSAVVAAAAAAAENDEEAEVITDYSWRNFFAVINFVHIMQKLTKRKTHRILLLVQYKSSAILKRILKVSHPMLQLYVLKVIKSQVPFCGRKWRQSNMKVITAIYLNCRPDLRDEWLSGGDVDAEVEESMPHEQALRALVRFFNTKHYSHCAPHLHRRSMSQSGPPPEFGPGQPPPSPGAAYPADLDVFPPNRPPHSYSSFRSAFGHESPSEEIGQYEVDEVLFNTLSTGTESGAGGDYFAGDIPATSIAWEHLGDLLGRYDDISDSESVGSIGLLDFGRDESEDASDGSISDYDLDEARRDNEHEWERINPETITALEEEKQLSSPKSPRPRARRSSSGQVSPALRPVLIDTDDDGTEEPEQELGPAPTAPHKGPSVDEVELVFGE